MSTAFRQNQILVSRGVYDALKVLADLEGASCPDEVADIRLGLLLSRECDIQWAISERKKRMEKFREDYAERVKNKQDEPIDDIP